VADGFLKDALWSEPLKPGTGSADLAPTPPVEPVKPDVQGSLMLTIKEDAGMSEQEIDDLVTYLSENPKAGDEMVGTGGRKFRLAGRGKGKSGGYRTVTFYSGEAMPVYLVTVF